MDNNAIDRLPGDDSIPAARTASYFFYRQGWHVGLLLLAAISYAFAAPSLGNGTVWGQSSTFWFWLSAAGVVFHQLLAWLVFRAQLGWGTLTKFFKNLDLTVWGLFFFPLLVLRPLLVTVLAWSDRGSLLLPRGLAYVIGVAALVPALYTLWTVSHDFSVQRALGGDHFRMKYRRMPLVRTGAFRWSQNAMYAFAFLLLWAIALIIGSQAALSMALFQHVAIWVHFYCTEAPDMELIYPKNNPID